MDDTTAKTIDELFRSLARPLWIVTAAEGARRGGLLATWVMPCSLDATRNVLLADLAPNHFTTELVRASRALAVHLLTVDQLDLAFRFALGSGRTTDKFAGVDWQPGPTGSPRISAAAAWLDCRVVDTHATGDREYFWAEVVAGTGLAGATPATDRDLFAAATSDQLARLRANLMADIDLLRPLRDRWLDAQGRTPPTADSAYRA